jgi:hypothetical protein
MHQYSNTNVTTHFSFNSLKIKTSPFFEHYLLILRRHFPSATWYIACVLHELAEPLRPTDITRRQYTKCGWGSAA